MERWAPIPLRLMLGIGFLWHGLPKFTAAGHESFVAMLQGIGVPAPGFMSWVVALVEVGGALLLLAGAFVAVASALLVLNMLVAMFTVHLAAGFNFLNVTGMGPEGPEFGIPGFEVNLLYIAALVSLILSGAGPASVEDSRRRAPARTRAA